MILKWNKATSRYRDLKTGRFVSRNAVIEQIDRATSISVRRVDALTDQLRSGEITLGQWQTGVKDVLRAGHTLTAALANGGKANMSKADWGRVGQLVRQDYERLNRYAARIEAGAAPIHKGWIRQYAQAIRGTFYNFEKLNRPGAIAVWQRHALESCSGCISESAKGPQPVSQFPPIGSHECGHNCKCEIHYR